MSARSEWESEVTVMLGHAISIPGHAELWNDHASWGGTVTFQSFTAVRSPEALELDIPRYSRHMVDVLRSSTNSQNGAITTLRFKGRGTLPTPTDKEAEPPLAVAG